MQMVQQKGNMMNVRLFLLLLCAMFSLNARPLKVLHMTFHEGCKKDFEEVAQELGIEVTTWFVQQLPKDFWEGFSAGNEIYNVGPSRAQRVWEGHKDFFNTFDAIITSDTAPLSRIFLQNDNWKKPLIIWICNRFDYAHGRGIEERFPDRAYYDLMRQAVHKDKVHIVAYTPYEHEYARRKGVPFAELCIKPLGTKEQEIVNNFQSAVPAEINKQETLFIYPRLNPGQIDTIQQNCAAHGMQTWSGVYNGPKDLKGFKGVLFFPYAFSNLSLFEDLQRGVIHFVPTINFLKKLGYIRLGMHNNLEWSEWYFPEYKDVLIYFDSWADLRVKVDTATQDKGLKERIRLFGKKNREEMISRWQQIFAEIRQGK